MQIFQTAIPACFETFVETSKQHTIQVELSISGRTGCNLIFYLHSHLPVCFRIITFHTIIIFILQSWKRLHNFEVSGIFAHYKSFWKWHFWNRSWSFEVMSWTQNHSFSYVNSCWLYAVRSGGFFLWKRTTELVLLVTQFLQVFPWYGIFLLGYYRNFWNSSSTLCWH